MAGEAPTAEVGEGTGVLDYLRGRSLDALFSGLALWMLAGVTLDFRVHSQGISFAEEGFLTPSHAMFYSAFLVIAGTIAAATLGNRRQGADWLDAVPEGYGIGVLGVVVFALAGPMDFLWHSAFGFEQGVEALTSPTHMLLAVGAVLFFSSPLRAGWTREDPPTLRAQAPTMVSAGLVVTTVAFFMLYGNPLARPMATGESWPGHGVLSLVAFAALLTGPVLVLVRRFDPAPGAFTLLFAIVGVAVTSINATFAFVPAVVATGLVADALVLAMRPTADRPRAFRLFAFAVPLVFAGGYMLTTELVWGLGWAVHVWAGAVWSAALVGVLVSYVAVPRAGDTPAPQTG